MLDRCLTPAAQAAGVRHARQVPALRQAARLSITEAEDQRWGSMAIAGHIVLSATGLLHEYQQVV
jgi:hypothetical protein